MGMGFGANYADVIEKTSLAVIAEVAWKKLQAMLTEDGFDGDNMDDECLQVLFAMSNADYGLDFIDTIVKPGTLLGDEATCVARAAEYDGALDELYAEFTAATKVGDSELQLGIEYHSEDDGDRYDDVNGVFFSVGGVYQPSPAGKVLLDTEFVKRNFFVTFG